MRIRVSGFLLGKKIMNMSKVFSRKSGEIALSHIRFIIMTDHIEIQAMNEKITVWEKIYDVVVDLDSDVSDFSFLVEASALISLLKNKDEYIDIDIRKNKDLEFIYSKGSYSTTWKDDNIYPKFFLPDKKNVFTIKSGLFVPILKRSFYFSGKDEFRPFIESAFLDIKNGEINVVTTDRFKMFKSTKVVDDIGLDKEILISEEVSSVLYQYLKDDDIDLEISSDGTRTFIEFDNVLLSDMNVYGKFPNYRYVFDNSVCYSCAEFNKKEFLSSVMSSFIVDNEQIDIMLGNETVLKSEKISFRQKFLEKVPALYCENTDGSSFTTNKNNLVCCVNNILGDTLRIDYCKANNFIKIYNPQYREETMLCNLFSN